ncbi:class I SAM-dependent methyltransferase [Luteimonas sp. XNQY3]|nr:methyltransferase domain-containing protein [Luteimonas sp. XNQY3]MCD9005760.1 class I SAM-dependent methyltransferase [Luteimonas sp. XNQY3]
MRHMRDLVSRHVPRSQPHRVLDIGSYDVNGSYKQIFDDPGWTYIGADLEPGPNVDVVLESPYRLPFASGSIDILVSGQAIEHMDFFWLSWLEMVRVVAPGGLVFLIAPSRGPEHRYPVDCWRFYPDGFDALARWAGVESVEITTDWEPDADPGSAAWGDTVGVFRVPRPRLARRAAQALVRSLSRRMIRPASGGAHGGHNVSHAD